MFPVSQNLMSCLIFFKSMCSCTVMHKSITNLSNATQQNLQTTQYPFVVVPNLNRELHLDFVLDLCGCHSYL